MYHFWIIHRTFMYHFWIIHKTFMYHFWIIRKTFMCHFWIIHKTFMYHFWIIHKTFMCHFWIIHKTFMYHFWIIHKTFMYHFWIIHKTFKVSVTSLSFTKRSASMHADVLMIVYVHRPTWQYKRPDCKQPWQIWMMLRRNWMQNKQNWTKWWPCTTLPCQRNRWVCQATKDPRNDFKECIVLLHINEDLTIKKATPMIVNPCRRIDYQHRGCNQNIMKWISETEYRYQLFAVHLHNLRMIIFNLQSYFQHRGFNQNDMK